MKLTASATLFCHLKFCIAFDSMLNQNVTGMGMKKALMARKHSLLNFTVSTVFKILKNISIRKTLVRFLGCLLFY